MTPARSPLAPTGPGPGGLPDLPAIDGVTLATAAAGVRYAGRTDVMLAHLAPGTTVAGVFTTSATRSAPVLDCQRKIGASATGPVGGGAAILVNSGNANAFTGRAGDGSVRAICAAVADRLDLDAARVFTASTGVIGERLPEGRIEGAIDGLATALSPGGLADAAHAIMTTDTYPKGATATVDVGGAPVTIAGIAKGSGMIAPDMATMLAYVFTDAAIPHAALQALLADACGRTFNAITVDGDTSTSDTLMAAATGASGVDVTGHAGFAAAFEGVLRDLAHQVVRDGEGATKFVTVAVTGAASDADAKRVALSIANSPLVKTAIAGEDPNWGRIVMAVGKSGARADRDRLAIAFGDVSVARDGWVDPDYREEDGAAVMKAAEIPLNVDLGLGEGAATVWTCDLTHGYIDINADYRS
ncbi:MAG: bifunctional glutamate N-acetyltransferase/amino-acid acetyltransferase ArgJ [Paracoccaceae bacterium]